MHVGPERLWRPDIMVYNSVEHFDYETTDLLLTSDGTVRSHKQARQWFTHSMFKYDLTKQLNMIARSGGCRQ